MSATVIRGKHTTLRLSASINEMTNVFGVGVISLRVRSTQIGQRSREVGHEGRRDSIRQTKEAVSGEGNGPVRYDASLWSASAGHRARLSCHLIGAPFTATSSRERSSIKETLTALSLHRSLATLPRIFSGTLSQVINVPGFSSSTSTLTRGASYRIFKAPNKDVYHSE